MFSTSLDQNIFTSYMQNTTGENCLSQTVKSSMPYRSMANGPTPVSLSYERSAMVFNSQSCLSYGRIKSETAVGFHLKMLTLFISCDQIIAKSTCMVFVVLKLSCTHFALYISHFSPWKQFNRSVVMEPWQDA